MSIDERWADYDLAGILPPPKRPRRPRRPHRGGNEVSDLRAALRAVLRDFDREPTDEYLNEAERIFRAALAAEADRGTPDHESKGWPCGNCRHDSDIHSPVNRELCAVPGCDCPGLLTSAEADRGTGDYEAEWYRKGWAAGFAASIATWLASPEAAERLAAVEHDQWMTWARSILSADDVTIGPERLARWQSYMVPYADLPESVKEHDRVWARAGLAALREQGQ